MMCFHSWRLLVMFLASSVTGFLGLAQPVWATSSSVLLVELSSVQGYSCQRILCGSQLVFFILQTWPNHLSLHFWISSSTEGWWLHLSHIVLLQWRSQSETLRIGLNLVHIWFEQSMFLTHTGELAGLVFRRGKFWCWWRYLPSSKGTIWVRPMLLLPG